MAKLTRTKSGQETKMIAKGLVEEFTRARHSMDETNGGRHSKLGMNFMAIGPEALARMALVLDQGARAHNDPDGTNWRRIPCDVHLNHLLYHVNAWQRGVVGEDHLAHVLCRAMMACETEGGGQWKS